MACVVFLISFSKPVFSQPSIKLQSSYFYSPTFDKIIQSYNFSRPWQEDKLVPLTVGYGGSFGWNWELSHSRAVHVLPEIGYTLFTTTASNNNKNISVGFHQFDLAVCLRTHPRCIFKPVQSTGALGTRWYMAIGGGFTSFLPFAKTNGELLKYDEENPYREISSAFQLSLATGFHAVSFGQFVLTPDVQVKWYPDMQLTDFAEAVNGHNITGLRNTADNVFFLQAGLRITYVKAKSNWWDKPRQGDKT